MFDELIDGDLLTLPRTLVDDERFVEAVAAYQRVLPMLEAQGDPHTVIVGKFELVVVALHADRVGLAEQVYEDMQTDLRRAQLSLSPVEDLMFPLMFRFARGETDGLLDALQDFQDTHPDDVTIDELVSMLQFGAEVHERRGSPLHSAYLLLSAAELYEEAAVEHDVVELGTAAAEAYRDHALFLVRHRAQCLLEAEAGLVDAPEEAGPEAWRMFLGLSLDGAQEGDDLLAALTRRILLSLDSSDRWGPASHSLRFSVGVCRIQTWLGSGEYERAVGEARRVAPIGDLAGEVEAAHGLRTLEAMLGRGSDGPDFGRL